MKMSTEDYFKLTKTIHCCKSVSKLLSSVEQVTFAQQQKQMSPNQQKFFQFWTKRSTSIDSCLKHAQKDLVKSWNPHCDKKSQWVWMELTDHVETELNGLQDYLQDTFVLLVSVAHHFPQATNLFLCHCF